MSNQVLSIEQCKELVSMGIDMSNASMCWVWHQQGEGGYHHLEINRELYPCIKDIPAFTLQDILTLLPYSISTTYPSYLSVHPLHNGGWYLRYSRMECDEKSTEGKTLLEAAFNMLKWCKENNYI